MLRRARQPRDGRPRFRAYITKYALTRGVYEIEGEQSLEDSPGYLADLNNNFASFHGEGKQWHRTPEGALARAEELRQDALKHLEKRRSKLEAMKFVVAPLGAVLTEDSDTDE